MLKKLLCWIVCFGLSILLAASGFFQATPGEIFFIMHMIVYGIVILCSIIIINVEESVFAREKEQKSLIVLIAAIAIELGITWVITLFGVDFYTAFMIFALSACIF